MLLGKLTFQEKDKNDYLNILGERIDFDEVLI